MRRWRGHGRDSDQLARPCFAIRSRTSSSCLLRCSSITTGAWGRRIAWHTEQRSIQLAGVTQKNLMPTIQVPEVEASDIQATVLRPRPSPYRGEYVVLRIDQVEQGREMLRRILPYVAPAYEWWVP